MNAATRVSPSKKRTNVTVNAELLAEARACGINLSALLEQSLEDTLRTQRRARYLRENQVAFDSHNAFIDTAGLFSDGRGVV